jgi:hypothetical protein
MIDGLARHVSLCVWGQSIPAFALWTAWSDNHHASRGGDRHGNVVSPNSRLRDRTDVLVVWVGESQGDLMAARVWECGKSEWPFVMNGIGVQDLPQRESAQTSARYNCRETTV